MSFYFPKAEDTKGMYNCDKCGLDKKCENPMQKVYGALDGGILIVTDSPDIVSDKKSLPLSGDYGKLIREQLSRNKLMFSKNAAHTYAIKCKITGKKSEIYWKCCRKKLVKEIESIKPKLIITVGEVATNSIINPKNKLGIAKLRNRIMPNHEFNCLVFPVFHPSEFTHIQEDGSFRFNKSRQFAMQYDMERIAIQWFHRFHKASKINALLQSRRILDNIEIKEITSINELEKVASLIEKKGEMAFDYETTNLKPYDKNHAVVLISMGYENKSWGIYVPEFLKATHKPKELKKIWNIIYDLLQNEDILKIIQNVKFEELVSRWMFKDIFDQIEDGNELGNLIRNTFCTMLATHVVDEREGCTSLDFQNLTRFGIHPYNDKVKKFLELEKNERVNRILECNKEDLIKYGGIDVITTYANYKVLDKYLLDTSSKFRWCYNFLLEGHEVFANMSSNGIPVDRQELNELEYFLKEKQKDIIDEINNLEEVKEFIKWKTEGSVGTKKEIKHHPIPTDDNELKVLMGMLKDDNLKAMFGENTLQIQPQTQTIKKFQLKRKLDIKGEKPVRRKIEI